MQKLFREVRSLDKRCYEKFFLSEDILMEQAANGLCKEIKKRANKTDKILFICGPGNNGADGISAARILAKDYEVFLYLPNGVKSSMCKTQLKRAEALHVKILEEVIETDIYVDCIFGSGLKRELDEDIKDIINKINQKEAIKISCDIPTGINENAEINSVCFKADVTITMGALKEALFSDIAKDFVGKLKVVNLGISRENYELETKSYMLEKSDLRLPLREKQAMNKGSFGHVCVLSGEKEGASILSCVAAFNFGAGLVSSISKKTKNLPSFIMHSDRLPKNTNVVIAGMGLGKAYSDEELYDFLIAHDQSLVIDADLFYEEIIIELLEKKDNIVLTPHPKEFSALLKVTGIADIGVREVQADRFKWAREFSKKYPKAVLLLKGANTLITQKDMLYVNPLGSAKLAKGGSGDVLAGMVGALLAQGYSTIDSAISASLAHSKAAKKLKCSSYGLNPVDLCEGIKCL